MSGRVVTQGLRHRLAPRRGDDFEIIRKYGILRYMTARKTRIVGLSGGIGSGKSTVVRTLAELGARVIDADQVVRDVQQPGSPALAEIAESFGAELIEPGGALDRKALGDIVFRDEAARQRLNAIVHPKVVTEMTRQLAEAMAEAPALVVLDIPLLFEGRQSGTGSAALIPFDTTLLVWVPAELQVERQMARDDCDEDEARRRIAAQMPIDEKRALADHIIDNSGTLEQTEAQVRALYATLLDGDLET